MFNISVSTDINCSVDQMWALLDDTENYPAWIEVTDRMLEVAEGGLKQDAEYREYGGIAPFKGESTWKVTGYEPQSRQVHVGDDGAMTVALEVIIAPNENGIKLIQNLNFKTPLVDIPDDADHVARAHGTTGAGGHRQNPGERQGDSGIASA